MSSCASSSHRSASRCAQLALHRLQALPARSEPRGARNGLTPRPDIVAYLRRRSSRGSAPSPQTANRFRPDSTPRTCVTRLRRAASRACPAHRQPVFGTEVRAGLPVKTTPTSIVSGPPQQVGSRDRDEGRQGVHRAYQSCEDDTDFHRVRTCPSAFTGAARQPETDGGRQAVEQAHHDPPSRETWHERTRWSVHLIGTASMTAIWR